MIDGGRAVYGRCSAFPCSGLLSTELLHIAVGCVGVLVVSSRWALFLKLSTKCPRAA